MLPSERLFGERLPDFGSPEKQENRGAAVNDQRCGQSRRDDGKAGANRILMGSESFHSTSSRHSAGRQCSVDDGAKRRLDT